MACRAAHASRSDSCSTAFAVVLMLSCTGPPQIAFGDCFIRFPYTQWVHIKNDSDHAAKFEVLPQDEHSAVIAEYSTETPSGMLCALSQRCKDMILSGT